MGECSLVIIRHPLYMLAKKKLCAGCGEEQHIWKNYEGEKWCRSCWYQKASLKFPKLSSRTHISPVSDKRKVLDQLYSKMRIVFLSKPENHTCRAKLPGCMHHTGLNLTIHHTKGRGRYYLDTSTWIPLCLHCHQYIEAAPKEAKELGLSQSRL